MAGFLRLFDIKICTQDTHLLGLYKMDKIAGRSSVGISISVVSHKQIHLIEKLLRDIERRCSTPTLEVLLTLNLEESLPFEPQDFSFPITVIRNSVPSGFAANHNQAFAYAKGQYFCVINPDIRLTENVFPELIACLQDPAVAIAGPLVLNSEGKAEDSARRFPSPLKILCKAFGKCRGSDYQVNQGTIYPDWIGGMFMLFRCDVFNRLGGFDRKFFLYYEDVDLCARVKLQGNKVAMCPGARVVHDARRDSHRSMRYFKWHLASMLRFFLSSVYWRLLFRK